MSPKKPKSNGTTRTRIMVFGTFDMVHPGHRNFFKQARALAKNPFLIVSIARSGNANRIKGYKPSRSETARAKLVKSIASVDKVVLGGLKDHLPHITKERPDIIALGYDQTAYVAGLRTGLKKAGLKTQVIRLKPHKPNIYKTSLLNKRS